MAATGRTRDFRVLSIQSHVVSGYVGNKCAVFPLQLLGFEVDNINSVQLSNHTGYKHCKGQVLNADELEAIVDGLRLNNLHYYSHLLTVCDPVLGDNGKLYVPSELLPVYREELVTLADVLTPNQFEAELLTGITIADENDVMAVLDWLHNKGAKTVVLTSVKLIGKDEDTVIGFASRIGQGNEKKTKERFSFQIPLLKGSFTGSGDLFAATFTAWFANTNGNLKVALEKAASTVHSILARTLKASQTAIHRDNMQAIGKMELQLIKGKADIENPANVAIVREVSVR